MNLFTVRNIDHVVFRVTDMEASLKFYTEVLGLDIAKRNDLYSMIHIRAGSSMIDLIDIKGKLGVLGGEGPKETGRNVDHVCLRVDPFDEKAIIEYFAQHNVEVSPAQSRYGAEGDGPSLYCYDPDGNKVELKGPAV